jgi:excisionase family DNA binding protein
VGINRIRVGWWEKKGIIVEDNKLVKLSVAGRSLGISRNTFYTLIRKGVIPYVELGTRKYVTEKTLREITSGERVIQ